MAKTSMAVSEMRKLLGVCKTESYWILKKNEFEVRMVAGHMRVMMDSFEDWYSKQFHYKKVTGEPPGTYWLESTLSLSEAAETLGIAVSTFYEVIKKERLKTLQIGRTKRIEKESFYKWLESQSRYPLHKEVLSDEESPTTNTARFMWFVRFTNFFEVHLIRQSSGR